MHEDEFELADTVYFEEDCKEVIYYLSTAEFDQAILTSKDSKQPSNTRVCNSCGADTKPILRIIYGGFFTKEAKRHICALCGENMYITGGGKTWFAKAIYGYLILMVVFTILLVLTGGVSEEYSGLVLPTLILLGGFWFWKRKK